MDLDFPYKVDYANRIQISNCELCKMQIDDGVLRFTKFVQSKKHDGKDPVFYHKQCFLSNNKINRTEELENFEGLRYGDQVEILKTIDASLGTKLDQVKMAIEEPPDPTALDNFGIEYSSSNDDKCVICIEPIFRNELRIKQIVYDTEVALKFGREILWNHYYCFIQNREHYGFVTSGVQLVGYQRLQEEHKKIIKEALPPLIKNEEQGGGPIDVDNDDSPVQDEDLEEKIARQTSEFQRIRKSLQSTCATDQLQFFLIINESDVNQELEGLLDRCADLLTFGALYKCQECLQGDMIFNKHGYSCNAMKDEWVMCGHFEENPLRLRCEIPEELKVNKFFATCAPAVEDRAVRPRVEATIDVINNNISTTSKKQKPLMVTVKDGVAVDPKSKLQTQTHVYRRGGTLYSAVLGLTDIQKNKNSYFTLQVLESDEAARKGYWLFNSWGRTGTDIGDSRTTSYTNAEQACAEFQKLYEEQTGNNWDQKDYFKRLPSKFYPIDINYNDEIITNTSIASRLSQQVEDLVKLLFNVANMKTTMTIFNLDLQKMPLGKLSIKQLQTAYFALADLEQAVNDNCSPAVLIGLSNKFYTLIPHNFGLNKAPIIDTFKKINEKREIVDSLMDIEDAYAMMTQGGTDTNLNSFDAYYRQLNADITPLNRNTDEFKLIETYARNTQVRGTKIEIIDVFKVNRHGEKERYEPFRALHNRQLLWHGSRTTNFASIISKGLKICAQAHGSMFGRGIYFADMISKSATYCLPTQNIGLMVLSEVALGNMHELNNAQNIVQPPPGTHSVKGLGQSIPDPKVAHVRDDGVIIPLGPPVQYGTHQRNISQGGPFQRSINMFQGMFQGAPGLNFNEYIIYNEAQINMQYLIKLKFG